MRRGKLELKKIHLLSYQPPVSCGSADLLWGWTSFSFSVQKMQPLPSFWESSQLLCRALDCLQLSHHWVACLRQFLLVLSPHSALFQSEEWGGGEGVSRVIGYDLRLFPVQKQHPIGFWRQTGWDQILALPLTGCVLLTNVLVSLSSDFLIYKIEILISPPGLLEGWIRLYEQRLDQKQQSVKMHSLPNSLHSL